MGSKRWFEGLTIQVLGTWIGTSLGGGAVTGLIGYLNGAPPWAYILYAIGGALIVLLFLELGKGSKERAAQSSKDVQGQAGFEFFAAREDLDKRHPLHETFKEGNEIYAYFLSGHRVFEASDDYIKRVKRLILPNPQSASLAMLQTFYGGGTHALREQIGRVTDAAVAAQTGKQHKVKWFQEYLGVNILVCNPHHQNGFVQIEPCLPFVDPAKRHAYRLEWSTQGRTCASLYDFFNALWDHSHPPNEVKANNASSGFISMKEAAEKVYTVAQRNEHVLETLLGRSNRTPEEKLNVTARYILNETKCRIYGTMPPATEQIRIPREDLRQFRFADGSAKLESPSQRNVYYIDLRISTHVVDGVIDQIEGELEEQGGFENGYR